MNPTRIEILKLYKELLRYGEMLVLTDKKYYKERIKTEFRNNRDGHKEDIKFLYEAKLCWQIKEYFKMFCRLGRNKAGHIKTFMPLLGHSRQKTIDKSRVPVLTEIDLEEHFIKGGGPGGQKVNKSNNCVYLVHKPTGLSVKVHELRELEQNRKLAREKLTVLLDNMINKEESVENQKKEILSIKSRKRVYKQKKLMELKNNWKQLISKYS